MEDATAPANVLVSNLLKQHFADANANANPMSYQGKSGKQYVAVVAGTTLAVYTLP